MAKDTLVVKDTVVTAACGYHGYCDYEATRYYSSREGQAESPNSKEARHTYYRREMRLGYDNQDD